MNKKTLLELLARIKEPSSYGAFAIGIAMFFPGFEEWAGWNYVTEVLVAVFAFLAFIKGEKK